MDPDVTLGTALLAARALADGPLIDRERAIEAHAAALAEAVLALDEWLAKGGYLPARWRAAWDTEAARLVPEADASGTPAWHRPGSAEPPRPEHDLSGGIDWLPEALS